MTQTNSRFRHVAAFAAAITLAAAPVAVLAQGTVAGLGNSANSHLQSHRKNPST